MSFILSLLTWFIATVPGLIILSLGLLSLPTIQAFLRGRVPFLRRPRLALLILLALYASLAMDGLLYPIHFAVRHDMPTMAKIFSNLGLTDQKEPQFKGGCVTPLQLAVIKGSEEMVDILLDHGADVYFQGCRGSGFAGYHGSNIIEASARHPELIAHLVNDRGIDPDLTAKREAKEMETLRIAMLPVQNNAEKGDASAQVHLGEIYQFGQGVKKDLQEAMKWYRKAADQGNAHAEYRIGEMYNNGQGVKKDSAEAAKWYQKAADQGIGDAQLQLSEIYERGDRVKKDLQEAYFWEQLSKKYGSWLDSHNLAMRLEKQLTEEQIAAIKRRVHEWRPAPAVDKAQPTRK